MKSNGLESRESLPLFEPGGAARDRVPGGLVSDINAAIEEKNWWAKQPNSRRRFLLNGVRVGAGGAVLAAGASVLAACTGNQSAPAAATGTQPATPVAGPNRKGISIGHPQQGGTYEFFQNVHNGAQQAATDLGVSYNYKPANTIDTGAGQARLTEAVVATKPNGIITPCWDPSAMQDVVTNAVNSGITVVLINASPDVEKPPFGALSFVGQDEFLAGQKAGGFFRQAGVRLPIIENSFPGAANEQTRINGFVDGYGTGGATPITVTVQNGSTDPTALVNAIRGTLSSHPDVDSIMLTDTGSADSIVTSIKQGNLPKMKVGTFDYTSALLDAIADDTMLFAIDQQQYLQGYYGVLVLTLYKSLDLQPVRSTLTGPSFVTKENVEAIRQTIQSGVRSGG